MSPLGGLPLPLPLGPEAAEGAEVILEAVIAAPEGPLYTHPRHEARETALVLLYEAEARGLGPAEILAAQIVAPPEYTTDLLSGLAERAAEIDELVADVARGWKLERMPSLDRCLLRIGAFELLYRPDVASFAVLSEAVDLASRYSTDESSRFVNGVLARIAERVRGETPRQPEVGSEPLATEDPATEDLVLPQKGVAAGEE